MERMIRIRQCCHIQKNFSVLRPKLPYRENFDVYPTNKYVVFCLDDNRGIPSKEIYDHLRNLIPPAFSGRSSLIVKI